MKVRDMQFLHPAKRNPAYLKLAIAVCFLLSPWHCIYSQKDSSVNINLNSDTILAIISPPIFSISGSDAESGVTEQDVSSLLLSAKDVFTQFASFQFGAGYFRMRGYTAENYRVMVNGVNINNAETGNSYWSSWGGLNDVTRYVENRTGINSNRYGFSGIGGYSNIDSKASSFKKGTSFSYASANRLFRHRLMYTRSTGLMKNGWAITLSASYRQGNQLYVAGTYFNGSSVYVSVDKKIRDKHLFSFTGFFAPTEQARSTYQRLETYQLSGTHYYNNLWGYQNGKIRNSTVSRNQQPLFLFSHNYNFNPASRISTSFYQSFGKKSISGIGFSDATNPNPEYYKYLPGTYYEKGDTITGNLYNTAWLNDVNTRQINWDRMIKMNKANVYALPSLLGQGIITNETRARYMVENRVEFLNNTGINCVYNVRIKQFFLSTGINANKYKNRKYKQLDDLLGATYWLDYDSFASGQGIEPEVMQNDISKPDRKIYKGDRFGYDYAIEVNRAEAWAQGEHNFKNTDVYAAVSVSYYSLWRTGYVANGKFPNNSKGASQKLNLLNIGTKLGMVYKINGRHSLTLNGSYLTRPPEAGNVFVSQTVRNDMVNGVGSEKVTATDINYLIKYPDLKVRFTYYFTQIKNQIWVRNYYNDNYNTFVNLIMKGLNQNHQGVELSLEKTVFTSHVIQSAFGAGQYLYTNRPVLEAWQYNNNAPLFSNRTVYLKNYRIGGSPQLVYGLGYKYNGKKFWYAGINFNFFDQIYVEPNPDRRTTEAVNKYLDNESNNYHKIVAQQKLPAYYTVNLSVGKSIRIHKKYALRASLLVNNILNNTNTIIGGYEQLRWDMTYLDRFDNKYIYMQGISYMALLGLNF